MTAHICDLTQRKIKRLLIECPIAVKNAFTPPDNPIALDPLFEDGYLRLPLSKEYRQINDQLGEADPYKAGIGGSYFQSSLVRRTIEAEIIGGRAELFWMLEKLIQISTSTGTGEHIPMTILDYCRPELEDIETAIVGGTEPFTQRQGLFQITDRGGSIVGAIGRPQFLPGGMKVKFYELDLRAV